MAHAIKILLVEDDPSWQVAVDTLLDTAAADASASAGNSFDLAAVVDNYDDALAAFARVRPDIVLLDWQIKGGKDGLAVAQTLLEQGFSEQRMILVTGSDPALLPPHRLKLVPKPRIARDLLYAIEQAMATPVARY